MRHMIDPFDEVENKETPVETSAKADKKIPVENRVKAIYEIFLYLFKFLLGILFIGSIILIFFIPEKGIIVESFEIAGINESSVFVANHLCFELQTIKEIYNKSVLKENQEKNKSIIKNAPILPLFDLPVNSLDYSVTSLGNVGMGGTSLSLGHLILSLKQSTGKNSPKITGSIQASGSDLRIVAILNKPTMAWEIERDISDECCTFQENIPTMVEDLAYQIAISLINENTNKSEFPKTWEAFKYSTLCRKAYLRYDATSNISYLNESKNFALSAQIAEPKYSYLSELLNIIGASYLEEDYPKEAEELFSNAAKINSSSIDALEGLGVTYLLQNRSNDSIEAFTKIPLSQRSADSWYNMGLAYYYSKNYIDSVNAFDKSINPERNNADAWYNKGLSLRSLGLIDEAIEAYDEALKSNKNFLNARINKGNALEDKGAHDEAISEYDEALKLDPENKAALINKGNALKAKGKLDEAISAYDEALKLDPENVSALIYKGNALEAKKEHDDAIAAYDEALKLDPKNEAALINKGLSLKSLDRIDEAIAAYDEALRFNQKNVVAWFNKGQILAKNRDYDEATQAFAEVLNLTDFKDKEAWLWKGYSLYEKGNIYNDSKFYNESIEAFDEAMKLDPQYALACRLKGEALDILGDHEAYLYLEKAEELDKEQAQMKETGNE